MNPPPLQLSQHQVELARAQLALVLSDPMFTRANRQSGFLRHVVENLLENAPDALKEHHIGVSVYGRRQDYDTREDPIVRVEAARLRAKLREYYEGPGAEHTIRFELPKGTYAPRILGLDEVPAPGASAEPEVSPYAGTPGQHPASRHGRRWAIGVAAAVILVAAGWLLLHKLRGSEPATLPRSVAVLPFQDLSERQDQAIFCEGLTDQVTDELSRVAGLRVAGRSSAARFGTANRDLRGIGSQLGVSHVLEGSVRSAGSRVRVSARLVDVQTGFQLWSANLDKRQEDLFALQDEIARSMARALQVQLAAHKEGEAATRTPQRLKAHNLFLEARALHRRMNPASLGDARRLHELAVETDPSYALAHSGLAHIYVSILSVGLASYTDLRDRAQAEAQRAVELDPGLADGYSALIRLARDIDYDWTSAQAICKDAESFGTNSPSIMTNCGTLDVIQGRYAEAEAHFQSAMQLDPLWPGGGEARANMLAWAGRLREAESQIRHVRSSSPEYVPAVSALARILALQGREQEALALFDERSNAGQSLSHAHLAMMTYLCARSGNIARAKKIERQLLERKVLLSDLALARVGFGDQSGAIRLLEQAFESREPSLGETITDPLFQPLRGQPGFASLMRKLNL